MENQDRYDELCEIISSIDRLVDDISDKYYKDALNLIKYEAQNELEEVSENLEKEQAREESNQEREYWEEAI